MGLSSAIISFFGLPLLSLLLIPALSSYTTSLNVLFFYMTWTTIVMSHPYIRIELVFSLLARTLAFILPSVLLFLFDILVPSAAILWKRNGEQSLPMGKKRGGIRLQDIKVVCWSLFNVLFGVFLQAVVEFILIQILGLPSALNGSMFLPTPWGMVQYLGFLVVFRDLLTWLVHRWILHNHNSVYTSWLAKAHQKWFHSLDYAWPSTAHYDHPVVWVLVRFIPTYIPAIAVRPHIVTFLIYMVFVSLEETLVYSGYTFMSMNWFLNPMARRLEDHMLTRGGFNYGSWGLFDFVFNTSVDEDDPDFIAHLDEPDMEVQMKKAMSDSKKKIRLNTLRRHTRPGGRGHARRHGE